MKADFCCCQDAEHQLWLDCSQSAAMTSKIFAICTVADGTRRLAGIMRWKPIGTRPLNSRMSIGQLGLPSPAARSA
jgi:hypothetical protein